MELTKTQLKLIQEALEARPQTEEVNEILDIVKTEIKSFDKFIEHLREIGMFPERYEDYSPWEKQLWSRVFHG